MYEYLGGLVWLLVLAAILLAWSYRLSAVVLPGWSGPPAWLGRVVLTVSLLTVVSYTVGVIGTFSKTGILIGVVVGSAMTLFFAGRRGGSSSTIAPPAPAQPPWLVVLAVVGTVATALIWAAPSLQSLGVGMYRQDSTWYHLTFSAGFFQTGTVGDVLFTDPLRLAAWFYPQNSELLHGVGMVAMGSDFLSPLINLGWMALAILAAWCAGRPFGAGALAVLAICVLLGSNMMQVQAGNAPSDIVALLFLLASSALLLNAHAAVARGPVAGDSSPQMSSVEVGLGPLFVAALAAGLSIGTKMTLLPAAAVLTVALVWIAPRPRRMRIAGVWLGGMLLTGGFWYLRNLVHAGNPLPWLSFGVLPTPEQLPLYPRPPHSVADYLWSPDVWIDWFAPGLGSTLGPLWPLLIVAILAGAALSLRAGEGPVRRALGVVCFASLVAYLLIPITAPGPDGAPFGFGSNLRYLAPAMATGLLLLVLAASKAGRDRWLAGGICAALAMVVVDSNSWSLGRAPWALALTAVLVLVPLGLAFLGRRGLPRAALGLTVAAIAVCVVALGYAQERTYSRDRYRADLAPPSDNPGFRSSPQWQPVQEWGRRQRGQRIGIVGPAGAFGQYVFYGRDLSNRVRYIGTPGPHGGFRPIGNCPEWRRSLNRGDYTHVVITPALSLGPLSEPQEAIWTRLDGAAEEILNAAPASVFRIRGRLDPRACLRQPQVPILPVPWGGLGAPGSVPAPVPGPVPGPGGRVR